MLPSREEAIVDAPAQSVPDAESSIRASERQLISRELHRSTSQLLVALQLQIGQLRSVKGAECIVDDLLMVITEIHGSIRQMALSRSAPDDPLGDRANATRAAVARRFHSLSELPTLSE